MFNELQLQLLMRERERALARDYENRAWQEEAQKARQATGGNRSAWLLKQTIYRTLTIGLLVILLAWSLSAIARA